MLILAIGNETKTREQIMNVLGISSRRYFRENYKEPAERAGFIAPTLPDKLTSKKQAYYLTVKGIDKLRELENKK